MNLAIEQICMDGGTQARVQMDWIAINEYAGAMANGDNFPPVIVFSDGDTYWLADGFHRMHAAKKVELATINADVRQGTRRDAILFSVGANSDHGVRRTNGDKNKAVKILLEDPEWSLWADREIARRTGTTHPFVAEVRITLSGNGYQIDKPSKRKTNRNGTTYTMDTSNIGKAEPQEETPAGPDLFAVSEDEPEPQPVPIALPITIHNMEARFLSSYAADVHLVITSPPYNVDIQYNTYGDSSLTYLEMITDIWRECYAAMVDGGRIAVVVPFGVGRNPWVPLASRVAETMIAAGFTLRGQIIWDKGTTGNRTTWGSFRLPTNPGLRDTTECVIVAHKGESDLEIPVEYRCHDDKGSYTAWLADSDYFMSLAQDHWQIAPESARRIGHPAPFPKELVRRLIHFYGFPGCHVVDPFGGSGTVGVVAKELGCQATLFEISEQYCQIATERIHG